MSRKKKKTDDVILALNASGPEPIPFASGTPAQESIQEQQPQPLHQSLDPENWHQLFERTRLSGISRNLLANTCVETMDEPVLDLILDAQQSALLNEDHRARIIESLQAELGAHWRIGLRVGQLVRESPAQRKQRMLDESRRQAVQDFHNDPNVTGIMERFSATVVPDSIQFMNER